MTARAKPRPAARRCEAKDLDGNQCGMPKGHGRSHPHTVLIPTGLPWDTSTPTRPCSAFGTGARPAAKARPPLIPPKIAKAMYDAGRAYARKAKARPKRGRGAKASTWYELEAAASYQQAKARDAVVRAAVRFEAAWVGPLDECYDPAMSLVHAVWRLNRLRRTGGSGK